MDPLTDYMRLVLAAQDLAEASLEFAKNTIARDTANAPAAMHRLNAAWAKLEDILKIPAP